MAILSPGVLTGYVEATSGLVTHFIWMCGISTSHELDVGQESHIIWPTWLHSMGSSVRCPQMVWLTFVQAAHECLSVNLFIGA